MVKRRQSRYKWKQYGNEIKCPFTRVYKPRHQNKFINWVLEKWKGPDSIPVEEFVANLERKRDQEFDDIIKGYLNEELS